MTHNSAVRSLGSGIREARLSFCFYNPAARPLSLKFSRVEKGYNTRLTVVLRSGLKETTSVKGRCLLDSLFLNQKQSQNEAHRLLPGLGLWPPNVCLSDQLKSILLSASFTSFVIFLVMEATMSMGACG